jgi:plasmid stabilization system protein ParE
MEGTFEKIVQRTPYVIAYVMPAQSETLVILHVIHMARDWSQDRWPD